MRHTADPEVNHFPARLFEALWRMPRLRAIVLAVVCALVFPSASHAHKVTIAFSGELGEFVDAPSADFPLAMGDALTGTISFNAHAALIVPGSDDQAWYDYRPTGRMTLTVGDLTWSNPAPFESPCEVSTKKGWPAIRFGCRFGGPDDLVDFVFMDMAVLTPNSWYGDEGPRPLGPFDPRTYPSQEIGIIMGIVFNDGGGLFQTWANAHLDNVFFTAEPGMPALVLMLGAALCWARRGVRKVS